MFFKNLVILHINAKYISIVNIYIYSILLYHLAHLKSHIVKWEKIIMYNITHLGLKIKLRHIKIRFHPSYTTVKKI